MSWLHRTVGLFLGAWLSIVGLSGATLVYWREIDTRLHRDYILTEAVPERPDIEAMRAVVQAAYPDRALLTFQRFGLDPRETYPFVLAAPGHDPRTIVDLEEAGNLEVFVDPATHAIRAARPYRTPFRTLRYLHREFLTPGIGERIEGVVGLVFLSSLVAGLVLWWRTSRKNLRRALHLRFAAPRARLLRDLHTVPGIYAVAILMFQATTGFLVADWFEIRSAYLRLVEPPAVVSARSPPPAVQASIDANVARDVALAAYPDSHVVMINFPLRPGAPYSVRLYPTTLDRSRHMRQVVVGQGGEIVMRFDPDLLPQPQRLLNLWMIWIHNGVFFGTPGRVLLIFGGLVLATLFPTGLYIWTRKRASRKPPSPGGA